MRKSNRKVVTLVLGAFVLAGMVFGAAVQADANPLSGLWPFGEEEKPVSGYDPYNTPYRSTTRTPAPAEPNFLQKVDQDVRGFFVKTDEFLHLRSPEPVQMRANNPYIKPIEDQRYVRTAEPAKQNWLESIFYPAPEPEAPSTIQGFLSQPRLQ